MANTKVDSASAPAPPGRARLGTVQAIIVLLITIVLAFAVWRVIKDVPHLRAGTLPEEPIDRPYVEHAWLAIAHIAPGTLYLIGAPFQLAYRIRSKHYQFHRRFGRVLLTAALLSGIFAIAFAIPFAFGGISESIAAVVFSLWFIACLLLAFRAIRQRRMVDHRRWMIRAFAIGIGVGSIRIWTFVFSATGLFSFRDSFGVAFWVAFVLHAIGAEVWLRTTPPAKG